jgi:hypothetical protein
MGEFAKIAAYMAEYHYEILKNLEISNQISALNVIALYEDSKRKSIDLGDKFKEANAAVQLKTAHIQQVFEIVFNRMLMEEPFNPIAFVNIMRYYMKQILTQFEESTKNQYKIMAMLEAMMPINKSKEMIEGAKKMKNNEYHVIKKRAIPAVDVDIKDSKVLIKVDIPDTDDPVQKQIHNYMTRVYSGEDDISDDEEFDEKLEEKHDEFDIIAFNHSGQECHIDMVVELQEMPNITDEVKQRCNELFDIQYKKTQEEMAAKFQEARKKHEAEMEKRREDLIRRFREQTAKREDTVPKLDDTIKIVRFDTSTDRTTIEESGEIDELNAEELDVVDTPEPDEVEGFDTNDWQFADYIHHNIEDL